MEGMACSPPPSGNEERGGDTRVPSVLDAWKLPPGPVSLSELEGLPHQIFTPFETSPLPLELSLIFPATAPGACGLIPPALDPSLVRSRSTNGSRVRSETPSKDMRHRNGAPSAGASQ